MAADKKLTATNPADQNSADEVQAAAANSAGQAPSERAEEQEESAQDIEIPCCTEEVHIAYRGKADDRLYIAYRRKWQEVRFYQQSGLRAFCATCRHRVL